MLVKSHISWILAIISFLVLQFVVQTQTNDEISNHIRKCCIGGVRHVRKLLPNSCDNFDYEVAAIPPLWRGLCYSTFGVCCSHELQKQHCVAGRAAAMRGSRCDEQQFNTTTAYADCCRSCQVGLAVRASDNDCDDQLFSYFSQIDAYRICCGSNKTQQIADEHVGDHMKSDDEEPKMKGVIQSGDNERAFNGNVTIDGTIVLTEDDDDICGKIPNLCAQICENTKEAYRCKCHHGFKLDDNQITCTPLTVIGTESEAIANKLSDTAKPDKNSNTFDEDDDVDGDIDEVGLDEDETDDADDLSEQKDHMNEKLRCERGYVPDVVLHNCIDIDECNTKTNNCNNQQYCHNTIGSYRCLTIRSKNCKMGYQFNAKTEQCEDYDECNDVPCEKNFTCVNYDGYYECKKLVDNVLGIGNVRQQQSYAEHCSDGFEMKHGRCVDIDECVIDENACDSSQVCTNDIGGYHCDCKIGFNLDATTNACIDINECSINNHNCLPTQRCDNTVGSYICTRLQSCGTGYTLNAETGNCDDDDECTLETHNCPTDYDCYNTKGSFRCYRRPPPTTSTTTTSTIPTTTTSTASYRDNVHQRNRTQYSYPYIGGHVSHQTNSRTHLRDYSPQYSSGGIDALPNCGIGFHRNHLGACVDLNECVVNNPCGTHQRCVNTNGSYRCQNLLQCATGFKSTPDGIQCVDVDECETGEHNCVENQICRNRNGGYICACPIGHQLQRNSNGRSRCVDVDECEQEHPPVCPSNAQCLNTIGSYYCECKSGFQKNRDNERICLDVDECQEIPGLCQQKCDNFWGGYRCTCNAGYVLSPDNRTCNDVDECEVHKAYKPCMGFCNNVPGSYECSCPRGYTLATDKNTCRDMDECATGEFCTGRNDICTNIRGSYKCTTIHCPYGYVNDPDQKNRCRQTSNLCDGDECYNKPSAYTYNFITLVSNLMIPPEGRVIFSLRGPLWYDDIDFDLKIVKIQAAANIEKASDNHFDTIRGKHEVHLSLKRSMEGPQEIELELSMTVFMNGIPRGKSVAKIFILVSQYTF